MDWRRKKLFIQGTSLIKHDIPVLKGDYPPLPSPILRQEDEILSPEFKNLIKQCMGLLKKNIHRKPERHPIASDLKESHV